MDYRDFVDAGLPVFALWPIEGGACGCGRPDCEAAGKHPRASNWQHTPIWSDEQLETMEAMGQFATGYGVLVNGLLVVDVDARNGGMDSYAKLLESLPEIGGAGLVVNTGSGNGSKHLYFSLPEPMALLQSLPGYPGIDFKSSGFVVGPGSLHASGRRYETVIGSAEAIEPAPSALLDLLKKPDRHRGWIDGQAVDVNDDELASMLEAIPNTAETDYEQWIRIGMALHLVTGGTQYALWEQWSAKGPKHDPSMMDRKWHSFGKAANPVTLGTLRHYAEENGWVAPVTFTDNQVWGVPDALPEKIDLDNLEGIDLLRPPGFVGELVRWIDGRCRYPRQRLAVAAALSTMAAVAGMRYEDALDDVTPNLFAFGVAGSATGKETILKCYQELLKAAGVASAVHGGIKSEQEVYRNLVRHQAAIYAIDELGEVLSKISHARQNGRAAYLEGLIGTFLSIYSKANSVLLITGDAKDELRKSLTAEYAALQKDFSESTPDEQAKLRMESVKRSLDQVHSGILNPYLCIFGLTTPERFDALMDFDMATNGFMGRAIIFRELDDNPKSRGRRKSYTEPVPPAIAGALQSFYAPGYSDVPNRVERIGKVQQVPTQSEAEKLLDQVSDYFETMAELHKDQTGMTAIPRRGYELVAKISILLAIPGGLRTMEHIRWAFALVKQDVEEKIKLAYGNSAADRGDALAAKLLALVTVEHGETLGRLKNKLRKYSSDDVTKMLDLLEQQGRIRREAAEFGRGSRKTEKYYRIA